MAGALVAVDALSFKVEMGEVYGLLGPNGAGQNDDTPHALGPLAADRGEAKIGGFGSQTQPLEVKRRVGLVSASAGLYAGLTVEEMLLFFADLYAVPPDAAAGISWPRADFGPR